MEKHCRKMIQEDSGFYWAYYYMQEACDELGMAQEVIDNYYKAKRIFGGHPEIYERVVRVFKYYQMGRDIDYILGQAREADVDSPYLMVCRLARMEENAGTKEECAKAEQYGKEVVCCLEERMSEMEVVNEELPSLWKSIPVLLASAYMEMAYIYEKKKKASLEGIPTGQRWVERAQKQWHDSMERYMKQAIKLEPDHLWNRYYLGRFYILHKKNYKAGYEHLKQCEERGMDFEWVYFYLAQYHEKISNRDEAIRYYIMAHEKAPDNMDFAWRVAWLYRNRFEKTEQRGYYELSLKYLDIQTERFGADAMDHWQYSRLYARVGRKEEAFREIDLTLKDDPSSLHLADKAYLLASTGQYQEALEYYIQAVRKKRKEGAEYEYAHEQVKCMFSNLGRYQEGVDWFEKEMKQLLLHIMII